MILAWSNVTLSPSLVCVSVYAMHVSVYVCDSVYVCQCVCTRVSVVCSLHDLTRKYTVFKICAIYVVVWRRDLCKCKESQSRDLQRVNRKWACCQHQSPLWPYSRKRSHMSLPANSVWSPTESLFSALPLSAQCHPKPPSHSVSSRVCIPETQPLFSFWKTEKGHLHQAIATNVPTSQETSMESKNFLMLGQPKQAACHQQQAQEMAQLSSRFLGWPQNISGAKGRTKGRVALGQWPKQLA